MNILGNHKLIFVRNFAIFPIHLCTQIKRVAPLNMLQLGNMGITWAVMSYVDIKVKHPMTKHCPMTVHLNSVFFIFYFLDKAL